MACVRTHHRRPADYNEDWKDCRAFHDGQVAQATTTVTGTEQCLVSGTPAPEVLEVRQSAAGGVKCSMLFVMFNAPLCIAIATFVGFGDFEHLDNRGRWCDTAHVGRKVRDEVEDHRRETRKH